MTSTLMLDQKSSHPDQIAEMALDDPALLQELLDGVAPQTQKSARRQNCSQALLIMSQTWPERLLPHWEYFTQLLKSSNGSSQYVAIYVISSLVNVDTSARINNNFADYFALLDDESVMVASHAALNAARIAKACPSLETAVIQKLLDIDNCHHSPGHLALVKAYVIEALEQIYETSTCKTEIIQFVEAQTGSESPKTVKLARAFLKKFGSNK